MFSFNKWILRNPFWIRTLYFVTIWVFFSESSFIYPEFYLQASILLLAYGFFYRPYLKLVCCDLKKSIAGEKIKETDSKVSAKSCLVDWEKILLVNGVWLFLLIPIKLTVIDALILWGSNYFFIWKFIFFAVIVLLIFYYSIHTLEKKTPHTTRTIIWSLLKNFCLLCLIPVGIFIVVPTLAFIFYYF